MHNLTLTEHVADWHTRTQIDRDERLVRNVALTGTSSKNGYSYQESALREAVTLYADKPVFLDHAADRRQPQLRSARDLVGTIVSPRFDDGRIRGDIRVLDTDSGRTFLALCAAQAPGVGMSHVVLAERASDDGDVSRIHDVISVDAVVFPATTTTFRESQNDADLTSAVAASDHDALLAEVTRLRDELSTLTAERDELQRQFTALEHTADSSRTASEIELLLHSHGLTAETITTSFRRELLQADDITRRQLVAEHRSLLDRLRRQLPASRAGRTLSTGQATPGL